VRRPVSKVRLLVVGALHVLAGRRRWLPTIFRFAIPSPRSLPTDLWDTRRIVAAKRAQRGLRTACANSPLSPPQLSRRDDVVNVVPVGERGVGIQRRRVGAAHFRVRAAAVVAGSTCSCSRRARGPVKRLCLPLPAVGVRAAGAISLGVTGFSSAPKYCGAAARACRPRATRSAVKHARQACCH